MNPSKPVPSPNPLTAPYWQAAAHGELVLPECTACGQFHFYPRAACPHCGSAALDWKRVSGAGEVYSYTVVYRAPSKGFEAEVPYVVAVVKLVEGPHLMSRLIGIAPPGVRIGLRVTVAFDKYDEATALPVFHPLP